MAANSDEDLGFISTESEAEIPTESPSFHELPLFPGAQLRGLKRRTADTPDTAAENTGPNRTLEERRDRRRRKSFMLFGAEVKTGEVFEESDECNSLEQEEQEQENTSMLFRMPVKMGEYENFSEGCDQDMLEHVPVDGERTSELILISLNSSILYKESDLAEASSTLEKWNEMRNEIEFMDSAAKKLRLQQPEWAENYKPVEEELSPLGRWLQNMNTS